ncbi:MAG TPA: DUF5063 domain-containing protein [Mariniphaga sp.]|nr:DUF5063 domain-containing protein [Mariniphaga sp.]
MDSSDLHAVVYSKNVVEFVTVANEFCNLNEHIQDFSTIQNLEHLRRILPLLYLKATLLPENEKVMDDELEKYVTEFEYNRLQQRWLAALGEHDSFYEVFDPDIQFGEEIAISSISENLLDIYQDLKDFITSYSIGDESIMNDALNDCVQHFNDFWGQRLVNVLRAIHKLITDRTEFDNDIPGGNDGDEIQPGTGNPKWLDKFWGTGSEEED